MAKKTAKNSEKTILETIELANGVTLIKYSDGTYQLVINLNAEAVSKLIAKEDDDEEDEEDEEEEEITPESLAEMDFEELEDVCDTQALDTDPDDYDEDDIEKLRSAIAKEMGIKLPKKSKKSKK